MVKLVIKENDLDLLYISDFLNPKKAKEIFLDLKENAKWQQKSIQMFGREIPQPRLTAWYGDLGISYVYSGLKWDAENWLACLQELRGLLEQEVQASFNSVLLNYYRSGKDSMSWHADDEKELGEQPLIASISLGVERRFLLKHKTQRSLNSVKLDLQDGSLLLMRGTTQEHWLHSLPKTKKDIAGRINLTYRYIDNTK